MIIKISRKARTGKILENYVYVPDTYSFHSAIRHIQHTKGVAKGNKMCYERVFDTKTINKSIKHFDYNNHIYKMD